MNLSARSPIAIASGRGRGFAAAGCSGVPDACTEPELRAAIQSFLKETKVALPRTNALSEQDTSELATEKFKAWLRANPHVMTALGGCDVAHA